MLTLLSTPHTPNNTDSNKFLIFSSIVLYYGDTYVMYTIHNIYRYAVISRDVIAYKYHHNTNLYHEFVAVFVLLQVRSMSNNANGNKRVIFFL